MFPYEKFPVYQESMQFYLEIQPLARNPRVGKDLQDQIDRAARSIVLNIAEGSGKHGRKDKRNFYLRARGSAQECAAALAMIRIQIGMEITEYQRLYTRIDLVSKMLTGLIKTFS